MNHKSRIPIIILHGWGLTGKRYEKLQIILEKAGYRVYAPDLPGFGSQPLTKPVMILDDYVDFVVDFLKKEKIKKTYIIGHSFGGRIAVKLAFEYPHLVEKIILTGAPIIRQPLSLRKKILSSVTKTGKSLLEYSPKPVVEFFTWVAYRMLGEWDYFKAAELRETFVNIVNEDLHTLLPKIQTQTLLVWGTEDTFVNMFVGQHAEKDMHHATFIEIPLATHKLPYEQPEVFAKEVLEFIA